MRRGEKNIETADNRVRNIKDLLTRLDQTGSGPPGERIADFLEELTLDGFDWDDPERITDLADYILSRAEDEFKKVLVAVSRVVHVEQLHAALIDRLATYPGHPLVARHHRLALRIVAGYNPPHFQRHLSLHPSR